jgi:hypothetical protein
MLCDPRLSEPTLQSGPAMFFYSPYMGLKSETTGQPRGTRNVHQVLFNLKFHWISPSQAFIPSEGISDPIGPNDVFVNQHNHHDHHCYYLQWVDWTKTLHMLGKCSTTEMHPRPWFLETSLGMSPMLWLVSNFQSSCCHLLSARTGVYHHVCTNWCF